MVRQNDGHFRHRAPWRGSGLAVPVFSMRTRESVGCGEFRDIRRMVDFVADTGMCILQVRLNRLHISPCVVFSAGTCRWPRTRACCRWLCCAL